MKWFLIFMFSLGLMSGVYACSPDDSPQTSEIPEQSDDNSTSENSDSMKVRIKVGSATFTATLQNNEATKAFKALLPMTINMSEMNGNEKYYNLPRSLPTSSSNPGTIQNGDLMLWGSSTLVIFYKTFSTSYRYTRIGRIDNPSGLQSALGSGSVTVTFDLQ